MKIQLLWAGAIAVVMAGMMNGTSWAGPRQVSNEPSTENFSGASQRNWSSLSFQAAYASVQDGSGVSGYGIGANAAFIPRNRLGRASLGLDLDVIALFLSAKEGGSTSTDILASAGPIVKVYPVNDFSISLAIRPGVSSASNGTTETDFSLSESLLIDFYPNPEIGIGVAPTLTQIFAAETTTLFHLSVMLSFNY